ncbi:hypothetical protein [Treponema pedis]
MKILFKKELYEFLANYRLWMALIIFSLVPYLPQIQKLKFYPFIMLFFMLLIIIQYIYDSYKNDLLYKGVFFLHNIKFGFFKPFIVKILFAFLMSIVMLLINLPNIYRLINLQSSIWFPLYFIYASSVTYICSIYARGVETTAISFAILIIVSILVLIFLLPSLLLKIVTVLSISLVSIIVCQIFSQSMYYRTQL